MKRFPVQFLCSLTISFAFLLLTINIFGCTQQSEEARAKPSSITQETATAEMAKTPTPALPASTTNLFAEEQKIKLERGKLPSPEQLQAMNAQFPDVELNPDISNLTESDKQFLSNIIKAADLMDQIFWEQNNWEEDGTELKKKCERQKTEKVDLYSQLLCRLIQINYGRYNRLDQKPFFSKKSDDTKPKGSAFYPPDLTQENFKEYLKKTATPEEQKELKSPYTVVVWSGRLLKAIPYSVQYKKWLEPAAQYLRQAAEYADSLSMRDFLQKRADAFLTNNYGPSEEAWVRVTGSKFEIVIGPYEVYDDQMMNYKAAFEAFVAINMPELEAQLSQVKTHLPGMKKALPLEKKYQGYKVALGSPIFPVYLIYATGQAGAGVQAAAFNLPNDEDVREQVGTKNVLLINVMRAKFTSMLQPISLIVLTEQQQKLITWNTYLWHILLHELSHGMSPRIIKKNGRETVVGKQLDDLFMPTEECQADVTGFWGADYLIKQKFFPGNMLEETAISSLPGFFRSVRFGLHEAHGKANLVIYNYLKEKYVYNYQDDRKFHVQSDKFLGAVTSLSRELLTIEATGDHDKANALLDQYGKIPPEVEFAIEKMKDLPVDIHPIYKTAEELRNPANQPPFKRDDGI